MKEQRFYMAFDSTINRVTESDISGMNQLYDVRLVAIGKHNILFVQGDNEIYCYGDPANDGKAKFQKNTGAIERIHEEKFENNRITHIACGGEYAVVALDNNQIFACGSNIDGAVGIKSGSFITEFEEIPLGTVDPFNKITHFQSGYYMWGMVTDHKTVYMQGYGGVGQMCNGQMEYVNRTLVKMIDNQGYLNGCRIIDFACPSAHGVLLTTSGVFVWGWSSCGQIGDSSSVSNLLCLSRSITDGYISCDPFKDATIIVTKDNEVYQCGRVSFHDSSQSTAVFSKSTHHLLQFEPSERLCNPLRIFGDNQRSFLVRASQVYSDMSEQPVLMLENQERVKVATAGDKWAVLLTEIVSNAFMERSLKNFSRNSKIFSDIRILTLH